MAWILLDKIPESCRMLKDADTKYLDVGSSVDVWPSLNIWPPGILQMRSQPPMTGTN